MIPRASDGARHDPVKIPLRSRTIGHKPLFAETSQSRVAACGKVRVLVSVGTARKALAAAAQRWLLGQGPPPVVVAVCETCRAQGTRALPRATRAVRMDATLPGGGKGDVVLSDELGAPVLVVHLQGKRRRRSLPDRLCDWAEIVVTVEAAMLVSLRWQAVRSRRLSLSGCRCAGARALPIVAGEFQLTVDQCPIRRAAGGPSSVDVVQDCGRCDFYVGLRYGDRQERHPELLCGFSIRRRPPVRAAALQRDPLLRAAR